MAGQAIGESVRTSAVATTQTVSAGATFFASLVLAALWPVVERAGALLIVAAALAAILPVTIALIRRTGTGRQAAS